MNRLKNIKRLRQKLRSGLCSIGTWQQIPHSSISEILGSAGYDWVAVDLEHGSIAVNQLPDLFRAIELGGTLPLARIAQAQPNDCKQSLDAGAAGIIVPMVENAEQLKSIRDACKWPPEGTRSVGFSRANLFGKYFDDYKEEAKSPLLIAQIEHINAVKNLEDILEVKGLDAIIIGPYDLSASMNLTGQFKNKEFLMAMDRIIHLCSRFNVPCGDHVLDLEPMLLKERIDKGFRFIAYSTDGIFIYKSSENPIE